MPLPVPPFLPFPCVYLPGSFSHEGLRPRRNIDLFPKPSTGCSNIQQKSVGLWLLSPVWGARFKEMLLEQCWGAAEPLPCPHYGAWAAHTSGLQLDEGPTFPRKSPLWESGQRCPCSQCHETFWFMLNS